MAKEDFTQMFDAIADSTADKKTRGPRREYNAQEAAELKETMQTSGKKGVKMTRINFAIKPSNYEYVKTMSIVAGIGMTEFVNRCIEEHKQAHMDLYNHAIEFRNQL